MYLIFFTNIVELMSRITCTLWSETCCWRVYKYTHCLQKLSRWGNPGRTTTQYQDLHADISLVPLHLTVFQPIHWILAALFAYVRKYHHHSLITSPQPCRSNRTTSFSPEITPNLKWHNHRLPLLWIVRLTKSTFSNDFFKYLPNDRETGRSLTTLRGEELPR